MPLAAMDTPISSVPAFPAPRRAVTAPIPSSSSTLSSTPRGPSEGLVETLYSHPSARIVSFTASKRQLSQSPGASPGASLDEEPGTLSWSSQLERTIAVGPFRIYRAPGSVAFLNCGSALQPILPKSQCWCIDQDNSKFVLQIRRPTFWRIELPVESLQDQQHAEVLRSVFDGILQFEKTECPFKRSFKVTIPAQPTTPVKKKPWTPVRRTLSPSPTPNAAVTQQLDHDMSSPLVPAALARRPSRTQSPTPDREALDLSRPKHSDPASTRTSIQADPSLNASSKPDADNALIDNIVPVLQRSMTTQTHGDGIALVSALRPKDQTILRLPSRSHVSLEGSDQSVVSIRHDKIKESFVADVSSSAHHLHQNPSVPEITSESNSSADEDTFMYELHEGTGSQSSRRTTRLRRTAGIAMARSSKTLSIQTTANKADIKTETPVQARDLPTETRDDGDESPSSTPRQCANEPPSPRRTSDDSFYSVQSWPATDPYLPPSPPKSDASPTVASYEGYGDPACQVADNDNAQHNIRRLQGTEYSNTGIRFSRGEYPGGTVGLWESNTAAASNELSKFESHAVASGTVSSSPRDRSLSTVRRRRAPTYHRATTSSISVRRRALSPLPPAANLLHPTSTGNRVSGFGAIDTVKKLPLAIISKTYDILVGPPSYLVSLMLRVAAHIAAGQWRGFVYGYDNSGDPIPVRWDYSEDHFSDWSDDEPYMTSTKDDHKGGASEEALDEVGNWGVD